MLTPRLLALRSSAPVLPSLLLLACTFATAPHLPAQTPEPQASIPTLTLNARRVIVDVVVTGKGGKPITGLHKDDFSVTEDGRPQEISSFEEHPDPQPQPPLPPLPPDVFTNILRTAPTGSPLVLLFDSLNTPLADQAYVHKQVLNYLQHLQPGTPTAIFTLGSQLRYIQGFTDDPAILRTVAQTLSSGAGPELSPLLKTKSDTTTEQVAVAQIASTPSMAAMATALQQFQAEQTSSQDSSRALITLDALQQLAHYLAGIPGRKSIAWFSGAFPAYIFPDQSLGNPTAIERGFADETRRTDAILAAAQVAIYPIAAEGLANNSLYDADTQLTGQNSQTIQQQSNTSLTNDALRRNNDHATMDQIASDTGGQAFYNKNGIDKTIAHVAEIGSHYYTLFYTPTKDSSAGQFRKIKVKLATGHYDLAYRHGYFTTGDKAPTAPKPAGDPLSPFMQPGTPDSTEIPLALFVQPSTTSTCPGDNKSVAGPLTCYAVTFVIGAHGLQLVPAPGNARHGSVEVTLLAYDEHGKFLNWIVRTVNLDMDAARYAEVQAIGVHLNVTLGVPQAATTLRGGVYDPASGLAGTLAVPLAKVVPIKQTAPASKPAPKPQ
jgi:VWFA-related protein